MRVTVSIVTALALVGVAAACIMPTGIDDNKPGSLTSADLLSLPEDNIFAAGIGIVLGGEKVVRSYETPIQFRLTQYSVMTIYGAAAAFEENALEMLGRQDLSEDRRRCPSTDPELLAKHRRVTLAYAVSWGILQFFPEFTPQISAMLSEWGLDFNRCPDGPGCSSLSTSWGLAWSIAEDSAQFALRDGWNADGSLSRSHNKMPYQDWRPNSYTPVNSSWILPSLNRWQPLLERDNRGFFYHQEHVVPHIGDTAHSMFLSDEKICSLKLPPPQYNLRHESSLVLNRTAALDDRTKAEVEFFDYKQASVLPLQVQYYQRNNVSLDSFEFIKADATVIAAIYEATIVSWREKVRHDLVRPTSIIHHLFGNDDVYSYGGPDLAGPTTLKGGSWEPYIRVMPHAEYPSGSSCVCKAFQRVMLALTGADDVTAALGGPLALVIPAGSSRYEQNKPEAEETLVFGSWSEIADRCGQSRLNGGMHFTNAVPAGEELCSDVGDIVAAAFQKLAAGDVPDYVVEYDAPVETSRKHC